MKCDLMQSAHIFIVIILYNIIVLFCNLDFIIGVTAGDVQIGRERPLLIIDEIHS